MRIGIFSKVEVLSVRFVCKDTKNTQFLPNIKKKFVLFVALFEHLSTNFFMFRDEKLQISVCCPATQLMDIRS